MNHFPSPSWQLSIPHKEQIFPSVPGIAGWVDDTDLKRRCSVTLIASYEVYYAIYTDGSASGGIRNEGATAVVTRGSSVQTEMETTIKTKGRMFTSTYEEKAAAME